jgi:hypothetical protein
MWPGTNFALRAARWTPDRGWSAAARFPGFDVPLKSLTLDYTTSGRVVAVLNGFHRVFVTRDHRDGTWSRPVRLAVAASVSEATVVATGNRAVAIWMEKTRPHDAYHLSWSAMNLAGAWSTPRVLLPRVPPLAEPRLAAGADGVPVLVWRQDGRVWVRRGSFADSHAVSVPLTVAGGNAISANVSVARDGTVAVGLGRVGHTVRAKVAWSEPGSGVWHRRNLSRPDGYVSALRAFALPGGRVAAAWQEWFEDSPEVRVSRGDRTGWSRPRIVVDPALTPDVLDMAADARGVIHVLWEHDVTGHLVLTAKVTDVEPNGDVVTTLLEDRRSGGYGDLDVSPAGAACALWFRQEKNWRVLPDIYGVCLTPR